MVPANSSRMEGERLNAHAHGRHCDRDLVLAFQAGSRDAFAVIYRRYHERVSGTCGRMLRNSEDVEEAVQETFLRAYQALVRFNGDYQVGAWLSRIATNICVDLLRARSRRGAVVQLASANQDIPDNSENIEDVIVRSDPRVREVIRSIKPLHARALQLRAVEGLSHEEMAGRLAMSPAQVKALLHRARRSFKRAFETGSAWIAAPVAKCRDLLLKGRGSPRGEVLLAAGEPAGSILAERAAAGLVIAAIAWTTLPVGGSGGSDLSPPPQVSVPLTAVPTQEDGNVSALPKVRSAKRERAGPEDGPVALPDVELLERTRRMIRDGRPLAPKRHRFRSDPEGHHLDLPDGPMHSKAGVVVKAIEERIEDVGRRVDR